MTWSNGITTIAEMINQARDAGMTDIEAILGFVEMKGTRRTLELLRAVDGHAHTSVRHRLQTGARLRNAVSEIKDGSGPHFEVESTCEFVQPGGARSVGLAFN